MKQYNPYLLCKNCLILAVFPLILIGTGACHRTDNEMTSEEKTVMEMPPSVSGENGNQVMVHLNDREVNELNIHTFTVKRQIHRYTLDVPGVVFPAPNHNSVISTPLDGRVIEMRTREGEPVKKGEILFRIESLDLGVLVSEYIQSVANEEYYQTRYDRISHLTEKQISSASELDKADSDLKRAVTISRAAYSKLRAAGIPDDEIRNFNHQEKIEPVLNLRSPINGFFNQRYVDLGQQVSAYESIGTVLDNRFVLIRGYLTPEDGLLVKPGDSVRITRRNTPEEMLMTTINTVNPGLDETNRSAIINLFMQLPGAWPKPGENVRLEVFASTPDALIAVPLSAITYDGNNAIVFVEKDKNTWEQRTITIRDLRDTSATVSRGLNPGEKIAVNQIFSLKALSRYELIAEE